MTFMYMNNKINARSFVLKGHYFEGFLDLAC